MQPNGSLTPGPAPVSPPVSQGPLPITEHLPRCPRQTCIGQHLMASTPGEEPWLVVLANFHDGNTPNTASFVLLVTLQRANWEGVPLSASRCTR